jgi:O-antigen ligase
LASINHIGTVSPLVKVGLPVLACLAVFFGLVSALLPAWFIFSALLVPAVAVMLFLRPEYALTACVALVCGLIHPALVPKIPAFGGLLAAADATLVMLAVYAAWTFAAQMGKSRSVPVSGAGLLAVALGLFGVCFAISVTTSLSLRELNPTFVLGETRRLLYLIALPIAAVILRQRERQERFVVSIVVIGCLFSVGQVLQGVFNIPVFGEQGISVLETLGRQDDGTTRANTLGLNVIVFSLLLALGAHLLDIIRLPLFVMVAGLLLIGIFLTYGRTTFATVFVCMVVVVWWLNLRKLPQLIGSLVLVVAMGSAIGMFLKPDSFAAVVFRMTSIGEELDRGYSAQWRIWEFEAMLPHVQEHPLIGIGLGADYKGASGSSVRPELNRYMHNAYLYMAGKMGLPALAFFLLSMLAIFAIGRRSAKSAAPPWTRVVGAASAAMMIRYFIASLTEPHFMSDYGVVNIAIAGALVYLGARDTAAAASPGATASATRPAVGALPLLARQ